MAQTIRAPGSRCCGFLAALVAKESHRVMSCPSTALEAVTLDEVLFMPVARVRYRLASKSAATELAEENGMMTLLLMDRALGPK